MKVTTENNIMRRPVGSEQTGYPAITYEGVTFNRYSVRPGEYVWRTSDNTLEVGRRYPTGSVFYVRVNGVIIEKAFATRESAIKQAVTAGLSITPASHDLLHS